MPIPKRVGYCICVNIDPEKSQGATMTNLTRRKYLQATLATLAGAYAKPSIAFPASNPDPKRVGFQLSELFGSPESQDVRIAKQLGVNNVIAGMQLSRVRREEYVDLARKTKDAWDAVGMKIVGVEGHPVAFEKLKLGIEGADEEIENTKWAIEALSKAGINMICYNFMAGLGWTRTNTKVPERGGAMTSEFDLEASKAMGLTRSGEVSEEKMWANITHFIKEVMPVADTFKVKMALHPDDPPISPLRGIARILTNARAYRRVMDIVPSPMNGVTFCQANFKLMNEDVYALAKEWTTKKKIFFVHFRDVDGTKEKFHETFHDNGPTDMIRMLQVYSKAGFDGPIRPDHAPTIEIDRNDTRSGYTMGGKVFAFGYMKGIMDALKLPYS
jgi:mannonate dehydratase